MLNRVLVVVLAIGSMLMMQGCWDRVEIEQRGFVVGTALDDAKDHKVALTFQFAIPSAMKGKGTDAKEGGGKPFINITSEANSVFKAARIMSNEFSRPPYLEHNRVIIISEKLARKGHLGEVIDLFTRDPETRRAAKVMIAEGEARQLLESNPLIETLPVQYIDMTAQNPEKSESITPPTNIGQVHAFLLQNTSFALPKVRSLDNKVVTSGAAIFDGHTHLLKGFLNEDEATGRNILTGTLKAGALELIVKDQVVVFEVKQMRRTIKASVADPRRPAFDVHVTVEGNISESHLGQSLIDPDIMAETEKKAEQKLIDLTTDVTRKVQKVYKTDIFGLSEHLYQEHYQVWRALKENWEQGEQIFSKCPIRVHAKVKLHVVGSILKSE
ncbi:MAG: germination protein Ger(x)C family [Paenibacillus sp.]|jgi:spore germination protein|uniref:Ger(x)C family spore germination protein n=1 Tax=Paenibacillus sp. GCM10012303 TaxID=3317340 RepID=UPI0029EE54F1|nr:germination protein Ger(x)C family [Paenibacillus sp.]